MPGLQPGTYLRAWQRLASLPYSLPCLPIQRTLQCAPPFSKRTLSEQVHCYFRRISQITVHSSTPSAAEGSPSVAAKALKHRSAKKRRLDDLCAELYPEHELRALRSWIVQGKVTVRGAVQTHAGASVSPQDPIKLNVSIPRYVCRAGFKLEAALQHFGVSVRGCTALDAGISTGGFTDCLLQHGAASVIGIDVAQGQVSEKVRADPRVTLMEQTNLRHVTLQDLPGRQAVDCITLDLSFISLLTVMPAVTLLLRPGGTLVTLIKPQFEAARHQVHTGGVVADPAVHREVLARITAGIERHGMVCKGVCESPVRGARGHNTEFLACFRRGSPDQP
ncbi:hypothetical protein WJX73_006391 [Symbiochloris irregularis]|uniref:RNA-binding S4 domain-containing protein n=1 Tax=Symbiochloris irregularis TaxID=706552 RepID=A0AAW1NM49_9CHLO